MVCGVQCQCQFRLRWSRGQGNSEEEGRAGASCVLDVRISHLPGSDRELWKPVQSGFVLFTLGDYTCPDTMVSDGKSGRGDQHK